MSLPGAGFARAGHALLRWEGSESPHDRERLVDLAPAAGALACWWAAGGFTGVRALAYLAERSAEELQDRRLAAVGPGAPLPALTAMAIGFGTVRLEADPGERAVVQAAASAWGAVPRWVASVREIPGGSCDFALLGCGGRVPDWEACRPLVRALRPEGGLVLFGLPEAETRTVFSHLAVHGFVLRGSGRSGGMAHLMGSLLDARRFLP